MSSLPVSTYQTDREEVTQTSPRNAGIPWYIWFGTLAVTSSSIGGAWDIAWHRAIGRDTFWTPAHMAIQACGVIAAIICTYLMSVNTFGNTAKLKTPSVNVLGFRAPLGAFIAAWGGIAMITSAPFDNWWHAAYGLDVQIISPPHTLLLLGIRAVDVGILFLIVAAMNRASGDDGRSSGKTFRSLRRLFLYTGGLVLCGQMLFLMEYTWDVKLHSASTYIAIGVVIPLIFSLLSQASQYKWAATSAAAVYTIIAIGEILIFPLFPAQPKLGPVFNPVTHLIPAEFPILLFVPALALDLLLAKNPHLEAMEGRSRVRLLVHRGIDNRRVAIRQFSSLQGIREPLLWYHLLRLQLSLRQLRPPAPICPAQPRHIPLLEVVTSRYLRLSQHLDWIELRTLDAGRTTMKLNPVRFHLLLLCILAAPTATYAHVGSKDVFETVDAGPYKLYVTIRMPTVIPGVAAVEVRSSGVNISSIHITPMPITGEASKHPPTADPMARSSVDPAFFTGGVWMMAPGSWEVRFQVAGDGGEQITSVPVPAVALSTLKMQRGLGIMLGLLGLFLIVSMAGIVASAVRDARLKPGAAPSPDRRRRAMLATVGSLVFMALLIWGGARWWNAEAASYSLQVFRPLKVSPTLSGNVLDLLLQAPRPGSGKLSRSNNDFLPDHGHLMHLYAIREPEMDAVLHLHPFLASAGDFRISLPAMPAGDYALYGDVVHANGFPETLVSKITVPANMPGGVPGPDDAAASPPPLSQGQLDDSYKLPDGYVMVWDRPSSLTANIAYSFRFHLLNASGKPAPDMRPYMGMAGHAAFVKTDGTVFAHTHPEGSAAMASMMLANGGNEDAGGMTMDMGKSAEPVANPVEFPYGFPSPGRYRIFIQMKHGTTVETGTFDAVVQ